MSPEILLAMATLIIQGGVLGFPTPEECCHSKTVGGLDYTLLLHLQEKLDPSCSTGCIYRLDGDVSIPSLFCFSQGNLPVVCKEEMSSPPTTEGCKSGWSLYMSSCYRLFESKLTWSQAQAACKVENGNLASIHDMGTINFITSLPTSHVWIWTGGYQPSGSQSWEWIDNSTWSFDNWQSGEPNGDGGSCLDIFISNGRFYDFSCSGISGYVCDKHWTD